MKFKESFALNTNIFFLIPLYFAIIFGVQVHGILIASVFVFSTIFHFLKPTGPILRDDMKKLNTQQTFFLWVDTIAGAFLIFFNLYVFWQKGFPVGFWYATIISIIALYIFFFKTKNKEYNFYHGIWHILASIITLIAVFV